MTAEQERAAVVVLDPGTFRLRRFAVSVTGRGEGIYLATSRGKAMADAWRCDAFSHLTYGEFLKVALAALQKAAMQFREYARQHRAKDTEQASLKAQTNDFMADQMDQAMTVEINPDDYGRA